MSIRRRPAQKRSVSTAMMKSLIVFAVFIAATAAFQKCCPQPESEGKCGCCPDACCCMCENITITVPPPTTPPPMTTRPDTTSQTCIPSSLDVVFIVDSSLSVGPVSWDLTMNFLSMLVAEAPFQPVGGDDGTRAGFVEYATMGNEVWSILDPQTDDLATLQASFLADPFEGLFTNTIEGMQIATNMLINGDRDDSRFKDVVVLLSDGLTNEPEGFEDMLAPVSAALRDAADLTFGIGIGPLLGPEGRAELELIVGNPDRVYMADDFDTLAVELPMILDSLLFSICETIGPVERTPAPTNPPVTAPPPVIVPSCKCCCPPLPNPCGKMFGHDMGCGCCHFDMH